MADREFAEVAVDALAGPGSGALHYRLPESLRDWVVPGARVRVPFRRGQSDGYLLGFVDQPAVGELKDVTAILEEFPPIPADLLEVGQWLAGRCVCAPAEALKVLAPAVRAKPTTRVILAVDAEKLPARRPGGPARVLALLAEKGRADFGRLVEVTGSRSRALEITRRLEREGLVRLERGSRRLQPAPGACPGRRVVPRPDASPPALIHGDGRLELYLEAIAACLGAGRQVLVLVPEIALAPPMARVLEERSGARVVLWQGGMAGARRVAQWREVASGGAPLVVGTRSAVFAPVPELGLLIVDDEHDEAYKQPETPYYHARDVALERARRAGAGVLLGSSTPSLEAYGHCPGAVRRLPPEPRPPVTLVDLREELKAGNRTLFSRELRERVEETLGRGQRVVLFLNRRGYAASVLCRDCGWVARCPACELPLTLHLGRAELRCHWCGGKAGVPTTCGGCGSAAVRHFGAGTERVQAEAREAFPGARVDRLDSDIAPGRSEQQAIRDRFAAGGADILVGTQLAARTLAGAALLGVVAADTILHLPDFRAAERTYQLLDGLCRRLGERGRVLVQTYNPGHYSLDCLARGDADGFYGEELAVRRSLGYPPFSGLARILVAGPAGAAGELASALRAAGVPVLGPVPAPGGRERWRLLVRGATAAAVAVAVRAVLARPPARARSIVVDVDPIDVA